MKPPLGVWAQVALLFALYVATLVGFLVAGLIVGFVSYDPPNATKTVEVVRYVAPPAASPEPVSSAR